jgi:hypothetical protein
MIVITTMLGLLVLFAGPAAASSWTGAVRDHSPWAAAIMAGVVLIIAAAIVLGVRRSSLLPNRYHRRR